MLVNLQSLADYGISHPAKEGTLLQSKRILLRFKRTRWTCLQPLMSTCTHPSEELLLLSRVQSCSSGYRRQRDTRRSMWCCTTALSNRDSRRKNESQNGTESAEKRAGGGLTLTCLNILQTMIPMLPLWILPFRYAQVVFIVIGSVFV